MYILSTYLTKKSTLAYKATCKPADDLRYIVVIPCYYEPEIIKTLESLVQANPQKSSIEVIIIVNTPEKAPSKIAEQNQDTYDEIVKWTQENNDEKLSFIPFHINNIPSKEAGAGLARKAGMDTGILRLYQAGKQDGYLLSLDADTQCASNYFTEIEKTVDDIKNLNAGIIYFEHPLKGMDFPPENYEAAAHYELFLRYYNQGLALSGFPYPFHTIGSAFFVRAQAYAKQGGMNKRKAGEDFYFLNKIFQLGNIKELNTTCVYPSSRPSDRVLFGTGPEVKKISKEEQIAYKVYDPDYFFILELFFKESLTEFYNCPEEKFDVVFKKLPDSLRNFLYSVNFQKEWNRLRYNCSNEKTFRKQFFHWFNGLKIIQFMHYTHPRIENKMDVKKASRILLSYLGQNTSSGDVFKLLKIYRTLERENETYIP